MKKKNLRKRIHFIFNISWLGVSPKLLLCTSRTRTRAAHAEGYGLGGRGGGGVNDPGRGDAVAAGLWVSSRLLPSVRAASAAWQPSNITHYEYIIIIYYDYYYYIINNVY